MLATADYNPAVIEMIADDHSLGVAGSAIRRSIGLAFAPIPTAALGGRDDEIISRLLEAFGDATDHGGVVSIAAVVNAYRLMATVPLGLPLPRVIVESGDEIGLDWDEGDRRVLSLTVDQTDSVGYSALLGFEPVYGRVPLAHRLPQTVAYLLARVYPTIEFSTRLYPTIAIRRGAAADTSI